jgi:hypothetical protein
MHKNTCRAHAIFESMVDRPNLEIIALHRPKWALDFGQFLVRANDIAGAELSINCRAQNVDAVKRGFFGNLRCFARKGKLLVADFQLDVLAHFVLIANRPDGQADLGLAAEGSAFDAFANRL